MFARNVSFHLKSNMLSDYARAFDKDILPLLRKHSGFKDEITFSGPGGVDLNAISLWDNKTSADNYNANTYPEVLKTMARFIDGTPNGANDVANSTLHKSVLECQFKGFWPLRQKEAESKLRPHWLPGFIRWPSFHATADCSHST